MLYILLDNKWNRIYKWATIVIIAITLAIKMYNKLINCNTRFISCNKTAAGQTAYSDRQMCYAA